MPSALARSAWRLSPEETTCLLAERGRFELPVGYKPTHAFQACALNHSAISPSAPATLKKPHNGRNIFRYPGRNDVTCRAGWEMEDGQAGRPEQDTLKTPSFKLQTPGKLQAPSFKSRLCVSGLGPWSLEFPWCLEFGV